MTLLELQKHFGSYYRAMKELKIAPATIWAWKKQGGISYTYQKRIQEKTNGVLVARFEDYPGG